MKLIKIFLLLSLVISCNKKTKSVEKGEVKLVPEKTIKKENNFEKIYETDNVIIYGNPTIDTNKINYASIKFEPYISFENYKTKIDKVNKNIKLDFQSNKIAKNYRTRLTDAMETDSINFAGHYTYVYWGCGSPCKESMIIDRLNGKIYEAPTSSLGYAFRSNSKMLIVNPPNENGFYDDCIYCKPIIYIFDEETKTFREMISK